MPNEILAHRVLWIWWKYDLAHDDLLWVSTDGEPFFAIDCSDVFDWGEADSVSITWDNVESLEQLLAESEDKGVFTTDSDWVLRLWCCLQRNQPPMAQRMAIAPVWFRNEVENRWTS